MKNKNSEDSWIHNDTKIILVKKKKKKKCRLQFTINNKDQYTHLKHKNEGKTYKETPPPPIVVHLGEFGLRQTLCLSCSSDKATGPRENLSQICIYVCTIALHSCFIAISFSDFKIQLVTLCQHSLWYWKVKSVISVPLVWKLNDNVMQNKKQCVICASVESVTDQPVTCWYNYHRILTLCCRNWAPHLFCL